MHRGFVPCPQAVLVHAENRGCLTDAATMHCECKAQRLSAARAISGTSFRDTSKAAPHPTAKTIRVTQLPLLRPQKEHAHKLAQLPSNRACPEAPSTEPYTPSSWARGQTQNESFHQHLKVENLCTTEIQHRQVSSTLEGIHLLFTL